MGIELVAWHNDLLGRKTDATYLYQLIKGRAKQQRNSGSVVINVDARWGQGKSYFIDNMYRDVLRKKHPAITIDAWKYDYVDDPYTYVMAELDEYFETLIAKNKKKKTGKEKVLEKLDAVRSNAGKLLWVGLKGAAKRAGRYAIGTAADEMVEVVEQYTPTLKHDAEGIAKDVEKHLVEVTDKIISAYIKKRLDDFTETKASLETFRNNLSKLIELLETEFGMQMPMYVFIDELDRCRPTYAIQMLERIKHLFDIPNLAFVVATDTTSLSHSVKAVYGGEFDSRQYLQRFFHRTYKLPVATREKILAGMIMNSGIDLNMWSTPDPLPDAETYSRFFDITSRKFGLSIRQAQQSFHILNDITNAADNEFKLEITFLYCLICEFISEGDLERNNFSNIENKTKRFGSEWTVDFSGTTIDYHKIISQISSYARSTIEKAFHNAESEYKSDNRHNNHYIFEYLKSEYRKKSKTSTNQTTEFYDYYDLINCAKNSYKEDDEDEYVEGDPDEFERAR